MKTLRVAFYEFQQIYRFFPTKKKVILLHATLLKV